MKTIRNVPLAIVYVSEFQILEMYQFVETRGAATTATAVQVLKNNRSSVAKSVLDFPFNKKRLKVLGGKSEIGEKRNGGIVYWMSRNQRVEDNWALLYAQALGIRNSLPLHVVFCLAEKFLDATIRHYKFMIDGLREVQSDCTELNIHFHLLRGPASVQVTKFVDQHKMGAVICDFSPLRIHRSWVEDLKKALPADVPLLQIDALVSYCDFIQFDNL